MNERLDRFTKLLKEIFELDKSDLDFGIYRVMNLRKTQIEEFLTQRLPQMVQETLVPFAQGSKEEIRAQMTQIEESVAAMGMTVDVLPDTAPMKQKYVQLKKQLAEELICPPWKRTCILPSIPSSTGTTRTATLFPSVVTRKACMQSPTKAKK